MAKIAALLTLLAMTAPTVTVAQEFEGDAPPQGEKEDYANYYLGVKREGLEPFWKAQAKMEKHESSFIATYRNIRKDKDLEALNSIIHPASRACEDELRKPYFEGIREFYLNEHFPDTFKVKYFELPEDKRWPLKLRMEFPAAPTHILYIEYRDGEYVEGLQRFLREETHPEKRFYELVKCPSEKTLAAMRADAERRAVAERNLEN